MSDVIQEERTKAAIRDIKAQGTRQVDLQEQARLPLGQVQGYWSRVGDMLLKEHRKVQDLKATVARQQQQIEALTAGLQKVNAHSLK